MARQRSSVNWQSGATPAEASAVSALDAAMDVLQLQLADLAYQRKRIINRARTRVLYGCKPRSHVNGGPKH